MSGSLAVLVLSCDKYADVWPGFFECFERSFPVVDFPIYLGSNTTICTRPNVHTVLSGADQDWSSSYRRILEQIPERKLFVILEDLFLSSDIDNERFSAITDFMVQRDAKHIRYWASPLPDFSTENPLVGECAKGAPYRSTVCGFWDRDYLLRLLIDGENPWNFEIMGSYRTSYDDGFYATTTPLCEFRNMIEKGYWIPESVDWAKRNGVPLTLDARPMLKGGFQFKSRAQMLVFNTVIRVPWRYRVRIMNGLRKLFISY